MGLTTSCSAMLRTSKDGHEMHNSMAAQVRCLMHAATSLANAGRHLVKAEHTNSRAISRELIESDRAPGIRDDVIGESRSLAKSFEDEPYRTLGSDTFSWKSPNALGSEFLESLPQIGSSYIHGCMHTFLHAYVYTYVRT